MMREGYPMRLLFATDRMHVPDDHSGSVQSTHALIKGLATLGHECSVLATLKDGWRYKLATLLYRATGNKVIREWHDRVNGYDVSRGSQWRFAARVERAMQSKPDMLVLDSIRMLRALKDLKITCPIIVIMHDIAFTKESPSIPFADQVRFVGNSPFTSALIAEHFKMRPVTVPPVVHLEEYITERKSARHMTLVSPHARKGLDIVLGLAQRFRYVPFLLVEGWPMDEKSIAELKARLPKNVTFRRSTADMRSVYRDTCVMLVPSEMETFGRVVVEAQANGIPVMARNVGSLPWTVGDGGVTLGTDINAWVEELQNILEPGRYEVMSAKAKANSLRKDFQPALVVATFDAFLRDIQEPRFDVRSKIPAHA